METIVNEATLKDYTKRYGRKAGTWFAEQEALKRAQDAAPELVTALEALLPHAVTYVHSMRGKLAIAAARDLLLRLKSTPTA